MSTEVNNALQVLINGGIILYPTDTIWGIGCDATNEKAVAKIFKLKKRADSKSLISLVADKKQLKKITGYIPSLDITSSPTTIIYPFAVGLSKKLVASNGSAVALRTIADECAAKLRAFCIEMEIRAIIDTPKEDQGLRMQIQLDQLKNGFGKLKPDPKENHSYAMDMELQSYCLGPLDAQLLQQLTPRLESAIKKLL